MKRNKLITLILMGCLMLGLAPAPAKAEMPPAGGAVSVSDADTLSGTPVELREKTTALNWYEERLEFQSSSKLVNPTAKKLRLTMSLPYPEDNSLPPEYLPLVKVGDTPIKTQYNSASHSYTWTIAFNPQEEVVLAISYTLPAAVDDDGLNYAQYRPSTDQHWGQAPSQATLTLNFKELHMGQIKDIQPLSYKFQGSALSWTWSPAQAKPILIKADLTSEKKAWESLIPHDDRIHLKELLTTRDYLGAAELFRTKARSADRETALQLKEAQGYYLEKAGQPKDALSIWEDLYGDKSRSARVYWALSQKADRNALDLYQRVKDLQINPLLQSWLAVQLPPNRFKPTAPENPKVDVSTDSSLQGLILKVTASDKDGDIQKVTFRYHWEDQESVEKTFELTPFSYEHSPSMYLPAPGPLKRLFYEVIVMDITGNQVTTSDREEFYLNNRLRSQSYPLEGAMLVLADDYTQAEQDKVYKWFLSYVKMAREAEFVPVVERRPYFIFLGQNHDFISQYQGPLFIMHTPAPFSPDSTRLSVHRYFLTYWYGPGWSILPETELAALGDALMLGKGRYVMVLKYLAGKDPKKFADLLGTIGQGHGWRQSLTEVYKMNFWEAQLWAVWYAYGNMVIAVFLIIGFAWLGKTGQLTRLITYLREKR